MRISGYSRSRCRFIILAISVLVAFGTSELPFVHAQKITTSTPTVEPIITPEKSPGITILQSNHTLSDLSEPYQHFSSPREEQLGAISTNLLVNGDFEDGASSPDGWTKDAWDFTSTTLTWDSTQAHSGTKSIKILSILPNDARWVQTVSVQPYADYRLSGWIKTNNVTHMTQSDDTGANLSLYGTWTHSTGIFGTSDWTYVSFLFNSGSSTEVIIACRLGYWSSTSSGQAWFDDVRLELINVATSNIQNPGFESGSSTQPDHWITETIQGSANYQWDNSVYHFGNRSIRITALDQSIVRYAQTVLVDQDSEYELSGWIKTENVQDPSEQWWTTGAKLGIYGLDSYLAAATNGLRYTNNWTFVIVRFITGRSTLAKVTCTIGEADPLYARFTSSGTMWCDDLQLTKIRTLSRTVLSGNQVALDVYDDDFLNFTDPATYLSHLDEIYHAMKEMVGGTPYNGDLITVRSDASMYYGLLSGNPITIGPSPSWVNIVNSNGIDWGVPHELGHDFDLWPQSRLYMGQMTFDGAEHWANLKLLYAYEYLAKNDPDLTNESFGQIVPLNLVGQRFVDVHAQPWIDSGRTDYQNMNNDVYTGLLYKLRQQIGWEPFLKTFQEYSTSTLATPGSDIAKVELLANTLSRYARVNLIPDFQSWGFPIKKTPTFVDVIPGTWYYGYVEGLYYAGITTGCSTNPMNYCPDNPVTRAAMAVFLLRAKNGADYQPPAATGIFTDLPVVGKEWMQPWVEEFYREGITTGCSADPLQYCPESSVTRAAMAVFLLRAKYGADYQPPAATGIFADLPVTGKEWMEPWVEQFYREGITTGCGVDPLRYCPEDAVKRQAMAVFIDRAFGIPQIP